MKCKTSIQYLEILYGTKKIQTFSLSLLHIDFFEGVTTRSVLVLFSPVHEGEGVYSRCFLLLGLPLNSSFTISYPFFAKSTTFASLNFWKAKLNFGEEILDFNFP